MLLNELLGNSQPALQKSQLLIFRNSPKQFTPERAELRECKDLVWQIGEAFGERTTIHGVSQLFYVNTSKRLRILWCLVLLMAVLALAYVCLVIAARYQRKQTQTVIGTTKYPVYKIPFPEITICNRNRLNWLRLPAAKSRFLHEEHKSTKHELLFVDVLARYDKFTYGHFDLFESILKSVLQLFNYVNFTEVVHFMAWRCDEIFEHCYWRQEAHNCCDIFFPRKSQLGACLAFNSLESPEAKQMQLKDPKWPWRVGSYGPGSGLTLRVLMQEQQQYPNSSNGKGLVFMVGEPTVWHEIPITVGANSKVGVSINSNVQVYDNTTRSIPPLQRGCVFDSESNPLIYKTLSDRKYMHANCKSECQNRILLEHCNCTMDLFFPTSANPVCRLVDMHCLASLNARLQRFERPEQHDFIKSMEPGLECDCLTNCFYIQYIPDLRFTYLKVERHWTNGSYIEMDLYFRRSYTLLYRTTMIVTWVDLLVSFGGVAGLFLGCSLMSVVELVYFFVIELPKLVCQERQKLNKRNLKSKSNFKQHM